MDAKSRIVEYLNYKRFTKSSFYEKTGLSNGFLDKGKGIQSDKLEIILATYADLSPVWLITGKGAMLIDADPYAVAREGAQIYRVKSPIVTVNEQGFANIPYVKSSLSVRYANLCGFPEFISKLPSYRLPLHYDGALRIFEMGDHSMAPFIQAGDQLIAEYAEEWTSIFDHEVYVVVTDERYYVLRLTKKGHQIIGRSDNPQFDYPERSFDGESIRELWQVRKRISSLHADSNSLYQRMVELENQIARMSATKRKSGKKS